MSTLSPLEQVLRRDRLIVLLALTLVITLAWAYTLSGAGMDMTAMEMTRSPWAPVDGAAMEEIQPVSGMSISSPKWTPGYVVLMLTMWWVMMIAMMLPSAAPTILLASAINRRTAGDRTPYGTAGFFTAGYLIAWLLFSMFAVAIQWTMVESNLLSGMLRSSTSILTVGLLVAAGVWQLSPIKRACLRHCRSPVYYLTRHHRRGSRGALVMGIGHGSYCLGCCWFLMALLFAGGIMDLYWIVGLALFVFVEKVLRSGVRFGQVAGVGLIAAGVVVGLA